MADGQVPYRDFAVEYPPAALPVFSAASSTARRTTARRFEGLMAACRRRASSCCVARTRRRACVAAPLAFVAVAPLAARVRRPQPLRPLAGGARRWRRWPCFLAGRVRLGSGLLGLATAAKVYPAVLAAARSSPTCGGRVAGARRSSAAVVLAVIASRSSSPVRAALPGRRLGQRSGARRPAAPDREPRLGDPARRASASSARSDDGVEPRLAESRRGTRRTRSRSSQTLLAGRRAASRSGSGSRAGRPTATGSSAPAPPPSARSSPSARCSRRSS